jgi:hypothetical protein
VVIVCGEEAKEDEIHDKEAGQKIAFSVQRFDKIVVGDREYSSIVLLCQLVLFSAEEVVWLRGCRWGVSISIQKK